MFKGENFCSFPLNCESFPMNYGLVHQQYKSIQSCYHESFPVNDEFHSKHEHFLPRTFYHM